jgi:5-methylcytosine-specific restriction endonuclease McrA
MHLLIDDQLTRHEKWHMAGANSDAAIEAAQLLLVTAWINCSAANREGLIPGHMLRPWAPPTFSSSKLTAAIRTLIRVGFVHDHETLCGRCLERHGELAKGDYRFHDWLDRQFQARAKDDPVYKMRERRRKQLHRRPEIKRRVRERDRDLCRFCGVLTVFGTADHKSMLAGQYDHLDPFDEINSVDKLVCSCKGCNVEKGERTPEQAGMILWPAGTTAAEIQAMTHLAASGVRLDIQPAIQTAGLGSDSTDPDPSSRDARLGTGPGRDGSPGLIPSPDPATETTETGDQP